MKISDATIWLLFLILIGLLGFAVLCPGVDATAFAVGTFGEPSIRPNRLRHPPPLPRLRHNRRLRRRLKPQHRRPHPRRERLVAEHELNAAECSGGNRPRSQLRTWATLGTAPQDTTKPDNQDEKLTTIIKVVDEVNVVFTVTDKRGKFVNDLKQDDFQVIDDGKPPRRSARSAARPTCRYASDC